MATQQKQGETTSWAMPAQIDLNTLTRQQQEYLHLMQQRYTNIPLDQLITVFLGSALETYQQNPQVFTGMSEFASGKSDILSAAGAAQKSSALVGGPTGGAFDTSQQQGWSGSTRDTTDSGERAPPIT